MAGLINSGHGMRGAVLFLGGLAAAAMAAQSSTCAPLGRLDAFWRYSPALGPFHEVGQALVEIPDYVASDGPFAYRKRPYPREVPFADHLSLVRILGGFNDADDPSVRDRDLAWRDGDGAIRYRMELLEPRLRPYLDNGYRDFTVVLDNVPWCFPWKPEAVGLGQHAPPRDPQEWHDFIVVFCRELERIMGTEAANRLRFRVGTECGGKERFSGTHDEFVRHYQASAAAVKAVLPGARVGPCNFAGVSVRALESLHNVRCFGLAQSCLGEANPFDGRPATPFDFIAFTRYFSPGRDLQGNARGAGAAWDAFAERFPELAGIPREIHEFDIAPWGEVEKGQFVSEEYGALGAAATALMMFRLRESGVVRLFHWEMADRFRDRTNRMHHLFTGHAWLLGVLERAVGGEAYLLEPEAESPAGTDVLGLAAVLPRGTLVVLAAYHRDTANHAAETFRFRLPAGVGGAGAPPMRHVVLDRASAVHDRIRGDLAAAGLLEERFVARPDRCGGIREMGAGRPAEIFVGDRLEAYHALWAGSLSPRPVPASLASLASVGGEGARLTVRLAPPQLLVLVIGAPPGKGVVE